jgi:hypothetical protein
MVAHVSARCETLHGGLILLTVGISKVSKGAYECGMLEDAGSEPSGFARQGAAHVLTHCGIAKRGPPVS